jgi:hypothetical protein
MAHRSIGQERLGFAVSSRSASSLDDLSRLIDWGILRCFNTCSLFFLPQPSLFPRQAERMTKTISWQSPINSSAAISHLRLK